MRLGLTATLVVSLGGLLAPATQAVLVPIQVLLLAGLGLPVVGAVRWFRGKKAAVDKTSGRV